MILIAVQRENYVYAYNEKSEQIINEHGKLHNYTDKTVTIIKNDVFYIYDCTGKILKKYPEDFVNCHNIVGCIL